MSEPEKKQRKPLSEESLEKLKIAREKANEKRKELSEQRKAQKEEMVRGKIEELEKVKQEKLQKAAEKEAKKRVSEPIIESPVLPADTSVVCEKRQKRSKPTVVVEYSSSDSEDIDFENARLLFVKKDAKEKPAPPPPLPEPPQYPHAELYSSVFGNRFRR